MRSFLRTLCLTAVLAAAAASARAGAPFTMERLLTPPYVYGSGARSVVLSDDGLWLACGWDKDAAGHRDLWTYNTATKVWTQHTDLWPEREARLRRDFSRDLAKARAEWEKAHPKKDDAAPPAEAAGGGSAANDGAVQQAAKGERKKEQEFDEKKRIEDFEKDLKNQRDGFGGIGEALFVRDSHLLLYIFEGAVFALDLDDPEAKPAERLRHEQGFGGLGQPPRELGGQGSRAVVLQSDADIFLWYPVAEAGNPAGRLRQLTTGGYGDLPHTEGYALSPDLHYLAYVTRDYRGARKTAIPDLLPGDPYTYPTYHVRPGDAPEKVTLTLLDLTQTPPWPMEVKVPDAPYYQVAQLRWSSEPGVRKLLLATITSDTHGFNAYFIAPPAGDLEEPGIELLYREQDDKWLNWSRTAIDFDSRGGLLLMSERDGLSKLYRLVKKQAAPEAAPAPASQAAAGQAAGCPPPAAAAPPEATAPAAATAKPEETGSCEPQLLYSAETELVRFVPLERSPRVLLQTALPDPSSRNLALLDIDSARVTPLFQAAPGWTTLTALNDGETLLAYDTGDERRLASLALGGLPPCTDGVTAPAGAAPDPRAGVIRDRLQDSSQAGSGWQEWAGSWNLKFITVPGDAGPVPVKLYLPPNWHPGASYPLLLWAHGAGYAETVVRQPGFYELFHPWAASELNWICAEVDYRGSEGYGRQWRTGVWGNLGHGEVDDLVAVKHYLVDNYGADARRTALWGWSYGGYLTLMALGLKPGEFPVGCAVAPVTRWENYFNYFAQCRLGLPADNPEEYERSSAETYLKDVKDRLLIIHGLRDNNTVFQSIAQYLEKSHELGISVELMLFPSDSHSINNEHHYVRVYQAIVQFAQANWE